MFEKLKIQYREKLLKITIEECDEDSKSFESLGGDLDHKSLHPNYKSKCFQVYEQKSKSEKKKLSVQIENFIKINSPLVSERCSLEISSNSSTQEQNEIEEIVRGKKKVMKTKTVCTSACIIT